ncbi:MAG: hypothetical protein NTY45_09835 [Elusimicrobia bacterium]|nr:hypothetical protein [Elusimicrobiota bacterium]
MKKRCILIKRTETAAIYRIDRPEKITVSLAKSLLNRNACQRVSFIFPPGGNKAIDTLCRKTGGKLKLRVAYYASKVQLLKNHAQTGKGMRWRKPASLKELRRQYKMSVEKYFYAPCKELLDLKKNRKEDVWFLRKAITLRGSAVLTERGLIQGVINTIDWKDAAGRPALLVAWVWISDKLLPPQRAQAHAALTDWLKEHAKGRIMATADSFNMRSRRFFVKLGFLPECVHFSE